MITPELISFIKDSVARGQSIEAIKSGLLSSGWTEVDINEAINSINTVSPMPPQSAPSVSTAPVAAPAQSSLPQSKSPLKAIIFTVVALAIIYGGWRLYASQKNNFPVGSTNQVTDTSQEMGDIKNTPEKTIPADNVEAPADSENFIISESLKVIIPPGLKAYDLKAIFANQGKLPPPLASGSVSEKSMVAFLDGKHSVLIGNSHDVASPCYKKNATSASQLVTSSASGSTAEFGWYYPKYTAPDRNPDFNRSSENYAFSRCTIVNGQTILLTDEDIIQAGPVPGSFISQFESIVSKIKVN